MLEAGQKFNRLTVIKLNHIANYRQYYLCKCDCGRECVINKQNLTSGKTKSCGCYKKEVFKNYTHRLGKPDTYSHWVNMKTRCFNKNNLKYKDYGGRGITVCKEWLDFSVFHNWALNNGFQKHLSLERINVNGNYCPENCTWITMEEQARNKRTNKLITYNGITDTVSGWTKKLGLGKEVLRNRLNYYGWSIEKALNTPVKGGNY